MSWEDMAARFEGLSEQQIANLHKAMEDGEHTLSVGRDAIVTIEAQIATVETLLAAIKTLTATVEGLTATIKSEIPRARSILAAAQDALATVNRNQRQWSR